GDGQGGEVGYHRLKIEQRLEAPLRDLGLVWRVRGVPARVLDDVALDHLRRGGVVVPHREVGAEQLIRGGGAAQRLEHFPLRAARWERKGPPQPDVLGDDGVDEFVHRVVAQRLQHGLRFVGARPDVAGDGPVGGERGSGWRRDGWWGGCGVWV